MKQYKEQATLELQQAFAKAEELAKKQNHTIIQSEDFLLGTILTPDTGAGRELAHYNITKLSLTKELDKALVVSEATEYIDYDQPDLQYDSRRNFLNELVSKPAELHHEKGSIESANLGNLQLSEVLQEALDFALDMYVQYPEYEGIDTAWVLLGLAQEPKSNAFTLLFRLMAKGRHISEISEDTLSNTFSGWYIGRYRCDGYTRREKQQKRKEANKTQNLLKNPDVSFVDMLTNDLVLEAKKGNLSPVIGRDKEIEKAIVVLSRKNKRNAVLLGQAGVGKTAMIEGIAQKIAAGQAGALNNKRILTLDVTLIHGDTDVTRRLISELAREREVIIFIDEIHLLASRGTITELLKPALSRGDISIIGASTNGEWAESVKYNPALKRRFEEITLNEPSIEDTTEIIKKAIASYENFFELNYSEEVLDNVAMLSKKYYPTRVLPDAAFTLLDNVGAVVANRSDKIKKLNDTYQNMTNFLRSQLKVAQSIRYNDQVVAELREKLEEVQDAYKAKQNNSKRREYETKVTMDDFIAMIAKDIDKDVIFKSEETKSGDLAKLETTLRSKVIGQNRAISKVKKVVYRAKMGLNNPNKPLSVLAFFGPTGVGKTEVAKVIAEEAFDGNLIRYDMSEFDSSGFGSTKLLGSAPGYIGYGQTKSIVDQINEKPNAVLLFDEIEKASPKIFDLFLQLFDEGRITDSQGKVGDFSQALIILTSNIGSEKTTQINIADALRNSETQASEERAATLSAVKESFRPELLNRIDEKIVFNTLSQSDIAKITELKLAKYLDLVESQGIKVRYDDSIIELIAEKHYDAANGARPIDRGITADVIDMLADAMVQGEIISGDEIKLVADGHYIRYIKLNTSQVSRIKAREDVRANYLEL